MTTLDDKLLGEKTQNYCSSSEDERDDEPEEKSSSSPEATPKPGRLVADNPMSTSKIDINSKARWEGYSQNTGPKGVIRDWQLFKEHEERSRKENERKLLEEAKQKSITCRPYSEDEKEKEVAKKLAEESPDLDLDELLMSDDVLQEFMKKRMDVLLQTKNTAMPKFSGQLYSINSADDFLKIIEDSDPGIPVVIHIYDSANRTCSRLNDCISALCSAHPKVQFCCVQAGCVGVSKLFRSKGVPALLVYKAGNLIGNFVQLTEEFGDEFSEGDVENFLIENGMIDDPSNKPIIMVKK